MPASYTTSWDLTVRGRRERIASPEEAQRLLAALPEHDRPIWATALYAGLRRGELMALRWEDVDLAAGVIRVKRAYDDKSRVEVESKSRAGRRTVPIVGALRDVLTDHKARQRRGHGIVFGSSEGTPFQPSSVWRRARAAWKSARLEPIGLHEARHTFASVLIASGVNAKAITAYMGHASIETTFDLYGKLIPVRKRKLRRWSTPTSPEPRLPRGSRNSTNSEVDLFDFHEARVGRI